MRAGNVHWLAGVVLLLGPGCYKSYEVEARGGLDAGADSTLDTGIDGRIDGSDAAPDTRPPLPDAMPIEEPPPPPGRCRTDPVVAPFRDPVLEWRWPTGSVVHGDAVHVCSTPLVIDLEPGGETVDPVLAFVSYPPLRVDEPPGILRIVDPRTNTTVSYPPNEGELGLLEATTNLAAGDINNDGLNEIVGIGRGSGTYAFRSDGTLLWSSFYPLPSEFGTPPNFTAIGGAVSLADLEGDGTVEVVVGRTVLEGATGEHRWTGPSGTARGINQFLGPISCVADLNGDGNQEVIAGHTAFRADGSIYWSNDELFDGLCAVADVYPAIPGPEVVLSGNGYVRVLNGRTGAVEWLRQLEGRVRLSLGGAPTVADFDGDGDVEFGIAHGAAYGVYDPSCSENPRPSGCRGDGLLWKDDSTADDSSSGTGSSVFDFNGDGRAEVVYNDQFYFRVYDGTNGRALFQHRNSSRTRTENPTIADIDNDGDAEIIFSANAEAFFIREFYTDPGVEVWGDARGRWVGARRIWNQHAYNISNVEEDGTIPRNPSSSWTVLNAYRQNLREDGDVLAVPDLWGGLGEFDCVGSGRAEIRINVQNWGLERAGAGVIVRLFRGPPENGQLVAEQVTTRTLEPEGDSELLTFNVDVSAGPENWYAVLDSPEGLEGGAVAECREDNNEVLVWRVSCP